MVFGQKSPRDPDIQSARTISVRAGRVANILLILALILPIGTAASIFGAVNLQLWRALPPYDPLLSKIEQAQDARGVVSGDDAVALKRLYLRLEKMTATAADARRAKALHIIFYSSGASAEQKEERIALDLSAIGTSAALFIVDRPAHWQIANAQGERAKLGFEGPFAFDLVGAPDGLLAGFRIGAFGAGKTASPRDFTEFHADKSRQRLVCKALDRWQRYFGVAKGDLYVWSVTNARRVAVGEETVTADVRVDRDANSVASACASGVLL